MSPSIGERLVLLTIIDLGIEMDVSDEQSVQEWFCWGLETLGDPDVLLNNIVITMR